MATTWRHFRRWGSGGWIGMPFTLTIRERNHSWAGRSPVRTTHATAEEAQAALVEYVARNWDAELGTGRPGDPVEMVEAYFSEVLEAYEIQEDFQGA
jgi:hypothetical protein